MNNENRLPPERMRSESKLRVDRALARIQRAQDELNMACSELSALCGGIPVWKATGKLADKVHTLWYRVDSFRVGGRYHLDDTNVEALLRREQEAADIDRWPAKGGWVRA